MTDIKIVEVGPIDAAKVYRTIETAWLAHYRKFMPLRSLLPYAGVKLRNHVSALIRSARGHAFLAIRGSQSIGAMTLVRHQTHVWLDDLFLLPGETAAGVGAALLDIAKEYAQQAGKPLRLDTMAANTGARRFYERHGAKLWLQKTERCWCREPYPVVTYEWRA